MRCRVLLREPDEGFDVSVPGLPGCVSQGATAAEALENIRAAITEYVAVIEEQVAGQVVRVVEIGEQS